MTLTAASMKKTQSMKKKIQNSGFLCKTDEPFTNKEKWTKSTIQLNWDRIANLEILHNNSSQCIQSCFSFMTKHNPMLQYSWYQQTLDTTSSSWNPLQTESVPKTAVIKTNEGVALGFSTWQQTGESIHELSPITQETVREKLYSCSLRPTGYNRLLKMGPSLQTKLRIKYPDKNNTPNHSLLSDPNRT